MRRVAGDQRHRRRRDRRRAGPRAGHQVHARRLHRGHRDAAALPADACASAGTTTRSTPSSRRARRGRRCPAASTPSSRSSKLHEPTLRALAFARAIHPDDLTAVTVRVDPDETDAAVRRVGPPRHPRAADVIDSPYREITQPLLDYVRAHPAGSPARRRVRVHPRVRRRALVGAAPAQPERAAAQGPAAVPARRDGHQRAVAAALESRASWTPRTGRPVGARPLEQAVDATWPTLAATAAPLPPARCRPPRPAGRASGAGASAGRRAAGARAGARRRDGWTTPSRCCWSCCSSSAARAARRPAGRRCPARSPGRCC